MARRSQLMLFVILIISGFTGATAEAREVAIDRPGEWDLRRLGVGNLRIESDQDGSGKAVLKVRLPPYVVQGNPLWYLLKVDLAISGVDGGGELWVVAGPNGLGSNYFRIVGRRGPSCRSKLSWFTEDLLVGARSGAVCGRRLKLSSTNVLPIRGVRPGVNKLAINVRRFGSIRWDALRVLPSSGLTVSRRGPGKLHFESTKLPDGVTVGDEFVVPIVLRNVGNRKVRRVVVQHEVERRGESNAHGPIVARGSRRCRFPEIGAGRGVRCAFRFKAKSAGRQEVAIVASGPANRPVEVFEVLVEGASESEYSGLLKTVLLVGGVIATSTGAVLLAGEHRRKRRLGGRGE